MRHRQHHTRYGCLVALVAALWIGLHAIATPAQLTLDSGCTSPTSTAGADLPSQADTCFQQGRDAYKAQDFATAATYLEHAAALYAQSGQGQPQIIALRNLSLTYQDLSQWEKSKTAIQQALALFPQDIELQPFDIQRLYAQCRDVYGRFWLMTGNADSAIEEWNAAVDIYTTINEPSLRQSSEIRLSQALQMAGRYRQAYNVLDPIVNSSAFPTAAPQTQAEALRLMGQITRVLGDITANEQTDHSMPALPELELSDDMDDMKKGLPSYLDYAFRYLQASLEISQSLDNPSIALKTLLELGNTAQLAYTHAQEAYSRVQTEQDLKRARSAAQYAADSYRQVYSAVSGQWLGIQAAINLTTYIPEMSQWLSKQTAQNQLPANQAAATYLNERRVPLSEVLEHLSTLSPNHQVLLAQLHLAQYGLACLQNETCNLDAKVIHILLNQVASQSQAINDACAYSLALGYLGQLAIRDSDWPSALRLTDQALELALTSSAPDLSYQWQAQWGDIRRQQGDKTGAIQAYRAAIQNLDTVRQQLVGISNPDLQFSLRDQVEPLYRKLMSLLLQSDSPRSEYVTESLQLVQKLQVAELENFLRCSLQSLGIKPNFSDQLQDLEVHTAIVSPILLEQDQKLAIILQLPSESRLRYYPITLEISDSESDLEILESLQEELSDSFSITNLKHLSRAYQLLIEPIEKDLEEYAIKTLVFVLDQSIRRLPIAALYDKKDKQYLVERYSLALQIGQQPLRQHPANWPQMRLLAAGLSQETGEKPKLPYVKAEIDDISDAVYKANGTQPVKLLDEDFTIAAFEHQILEQDFSVVHIATHGSYSSSPEQTYIQAYPRETIVNINKLREIFQPQQSVDPVNLLVLSACQTATGDNRSVLGLAGMAVQTGIPSVIASLQQVSDQSTSTLMQAFYQALTHSPVSLAEALQAAQISLISDSSSADHRNPYYWAPFILVGDWH